MDCRHVKYGYYVNDSCKKRGGQGSTNINSRVKPAIAVPVDDARILTGQLGVMLPASVDSDANVAADSLSSRIWRLAQWSRRPPSYVYKPLAKGQFRLLHLLAANGDGDGNGNGNDDVVRIRLVAEALDAAPVYHAVSYAWGDPRRTAGIVCEGAEICVTTNLLDALRQWRRADEDVVLWADAVCIDQGSPLEKSQQIMLMADIYSRAASVLIWLGKDDTGLERLEALVDDGLGALPQVVDDPAQNRARLETWAAGDEMDAATDLDWAPLRSLLGHSWFDRKWVFQEAIANEQTWLHCGRFRLALEPVSDLGLRLATFNVQPDPVHAARVYNLAIMHMAGWYRGKQPVTLLDAVKATRSFQCTDPRDHVLGILAQATDIDRDSLVLDDMHSLPVQECYLRFAKAQLLERRNLDVLALAPHRLFSDAVCPWWYRPYYRWQKRRLPGLPSWVPDLRLQELQELTTYTFRYGKFAAGGAETGTIEVIDDKLLRCSGLVVDVVEHPGVFLFDLPLPPVPARCPIPPDATKPDQLRNLLRCLNYYKACVRLASASESDDVRDLDPERLASLWKTMTCERAGLSDRIDVDMSGPFKALLTGLNTFLTSEDLQEAIAGALSMKASLVIEAGLLGGAIPRRVSRTAEGRLCAVPKEARVGDVICVLLGSAVPFVVRPTVRGMYELIGEAYVSGIMDGEALSGKYGQVDITLE